jgi:putative membrane protein
MSDKMIFRLIAATSVFVFTVVLVLNRHLIPGPAQAPSFVQYLPKLNAIINGTCSILLLLSLYFIRKKNIPVHKRINITAFILSSVFLVSYILFHYLSKETLYGDTNHNGVIDAPETAAVGSMRTIYLVILTTHIILAAIVLPLVLISFQRGLQLNVEKHRKIVRWSFPIWLYVTITGVVVYFMISPYYSF